MSSPADTIRVGSIVTGPTLPEPIEVLATVPLGESLKVIGRGRNTGMTFDPVLTPAQLNVSADREPFDGDARMFRLGIEAQRLGLAYEYDPFVSPSVTSLDPIRTCYVAVARSLRSGPGISNELTTGQSKSMTTRRQRTACKRVHGHPGTLR